MSDPKGVMTDPQLRTAGLEYHKDYGAFYYS